VGSRKPPEGEGSGLSLQTLAISAISAVAAATLVPLVWEKGTIVATALTPVVVALVSEALNKPATVIRTVAPRVVRRDAPAEPEVRRFEPLDPVTPEGGVSREDPFGLRRAQRRPRWKLAVITGLLAFGIAAAVVTASELTLFGGSVSGSGETTLWGGKKTPSRRDRATPTPTPSPTPSASATPTVTPSATPAASPTPLPTPTPSAPPESTPAPAPSPTP
jgi:hypothetical protein